MGGARAGRGHTCRSQEAPQHESRRLEGNALDAFGASWSIGLWAGSAHLNLGRPGASHGSTCTSPVYDYSNREPKQACELNEAPPETGIAFQDPTKRIVEIWSDAMLPISCEQKTRSARSHFVEFLESTPIRPPIGPASPPAYMFGCQTCSEASQFLASTVE